MSKIKICHVVNLITGKSDGVYTHLKMLFKYLDSTKYQQYLVFQGNPVIEEEVKNLGVVVYSLPSLEKKFSIATFTELYKFLKENDISIIHAHFIKPYVIVGVVNLILRKKAIFNYHGSFITNSEYYTFFEETVYRMVHFFVYLCHSYDRVVVPSRASQKALLGETRLLPRVEVYYNGYVLGETEGIEYPPLPANNVPAPGKHGIGIISRLDPEKRIDVALYIVRELLSHRSDIHFYIFGDGSLEEEVKALVITLQLSEYVTILGFVPSAKLYLNAFDVVLLTSDREGMPLIVWEAMAAGVPVVASDVGGIREIIEPEGCGRVFERRNVRMAATMLNELLNNEPLRKQMGERGKYAIKEKYNEKAFALRFEHIYSSVLNSL